VSVTAGETEAGLAENSQVLDNDQRRRCGGRFCDSDTVYKLFTYLQRRGQQTMVRALVLGRFSQKN